MTKALFTRDYITSWPLVICDNCRGCLWSHLMWSTLSIISKVKNSTAYYVLYFAKHGCSVKISVLCKSQCLWSGIVFIFCSQTTEPLFNLLAAHYTTYMTWYKELQVRINASNTCKVEAEQLFKYITNVFRVRISILHRALTPHQKIMSVNKKDFPHPMWMCLVIHKHEMEIS